MNFHYCGNPVHDIVHNLFVLLLVLPDWLPGVLAARGELKKILLRQPHEDREV